MQTLTQRRSVPVDAAKTAAIFGTLLIHASAAGGFAGAPGSFGWTSALFWNCLLRSAVPVFFLCSGALLLPAGDPLFQSQLGAAGNLGGQCALPADAGGAVLPGLPMGPAEAVTRPPLLKNAPARAVRPGLVL